MKTLLSATAALALMTAPVFAQDAATTEPVTDTTVVTTDAPVDAPATAVPADAAAATATGADVSADAAKSDPGEAMQTGLLRGSALKGVDVFTVDVTGQTAWDDNAVLTEINQDWDKIGEIEDIVFDHQGNIVGMIAEVGGFLGLGEKEVILKPEEATFVVTEDRIAVVSALSKEALEQREQIAEDLRDKN